MKHFSAQKGNGLARQELIKFIKAKNSYYTAAIFEGHSVEQLKVIAARIKDKMPPPVFS